MRTGLTLALSTSLSLAALAALATAQAEVLWRGDFETGDLSQWNSTLNPMTGQRTNIEAVPSPVFAGDYAGALTIHPDDLWSNGHNRVELHYDAERTGEGETTFFSWYFQLPENVGVHEDIAYWESNVSYQQAMALYVDPAATGMELGFRTNRPSGMERWSGPIAAGAWHQIAMQILWSTDANVGKVSLWLDAERVVDDVSAQTKPDANPVFIQIGFHRNQTEAPVETIYVDNAVEGTTLDDVLAPPGTGGAGGSGGTSGSGGVVAGGSAGTTGGSGGAGANGGSNAGSSGSSGGGGSGNVPATGGAPAMGGASSGSGGSGNTSGSAAEDDSGCGCRSAGRNPSSSLVGLGLVFALLLGRRRR